MSVPTQPPFAPSPFEVELATYLNLPHDQVVAGSFDADDDNNIVRWEQVIDGHRRQQTVRLERGVLEELRRRTLQERPWEPDPSWPEDVKTFTTGLYLYLSTQPPAEQRRIVQSVARYMMEKAAE